VLGGGGGAAVLLGGAGDAVERAATQVATCLL